MSTTIVIKGLALYVTDLLLRLIGFHVQAFAKQRWTKETKDSRSLKFCDILVQFPLASFQSMSRLN